MQNIQKKLIFAFGFLSALLVLLVSYSIWKVKIDESNYLPLKEHWHIEINDTVYEDVTLDGFLFPAVNKGDVVKMYCVLPYKNRIQNPILRLYTIHSDVEVWYNNMMIYEYGKDLREEGKMVGYGYHFIHIPLGYQYSMITIVMHITENDAFSNFMIPDICNSDVVIRDYILQNRIQLAVNMFLIIFGMLVLLVSLFFCFHDKKFFRLLCVGGFSLGIGCWSLCSYDLIFLFTYELQVKAYLEFGALYLTPLFVLLYFWEDEMVTGNRLVKTIYLLLLGAQGLFFVVACVLQFTNIMHFPALLKIQHFILLVFAVGIIALMIYEFAKKQLKNVALVIGISIMMIIGLYDMLRFTVLKYWIPSGESHYTSIMCVGAMIFVLAQLVDFGMEIGKIFFKGAKTQLLEQLAYVDDMTGTANRRRCEELWDSFDRSGMDYGIFAFDLNFLKKTNDTMGHGMGDTLIRSLARVLSKVFDKVGTVGRIGGDEFVVLIPDMKNVNVEQLEQELEAEIKKENKKNTKVQLSTAYGFCRHSDEPDLDSRQIYRKADSYMYQKKVAMKAVRKD